MLEYPIMVWWIVGSILHDGSIKLLLVPASALYLVYQRLSVLCAILCGGGGGGAYKRSLAAN